MVLTRGLTRPVSCPKLDGLSHRQEEKLMSQSEIAAVNRMFEEAAGKGDLESLASLYRLPDLP